MSNLGYRQAGLSDLPILKQLAEQTFDDAFKHRTDPVSYEKYVSETFSEAQVAIDLTTPGSLYYLVFDDGAPIAYIRLRQDRPRADLPEQQMEMQRLYILKSHWGKKIGTLLLEVAYQELILQGGGWLWLVVWCENHEAIAFYEKNGFETFAQHDFVFGDEIHKDPVMRKYISGDIS